ncbi:hypothetical protein [Streptomyces sp. NPDC048845]|uniref:hypothetical protein n=1 Tax=Streptomyces sp. NPDC048845 TaxID=3155390 RepID=UPI003440BB8C
MRIEAGGVRVTTYQGSGSYRYRYEGFKYYTYSDGKLFLLPSGWTYDAPRVFVLQERDGIRVEYTWP